MKKILNLALCLFLLCSCSAATKGHVEEASNYSSQYQGFTYYRDQLNDSDTKIYDLIYYHISKRDESYGIEAKDKDTLFKIYNYVLSDHPELFWEDGSEVTYTESAQTFEIYASKTFTNEEIRAYEKQLDEITQPIMDHVAKLSNDFEKVRYIYDYLIDETSYNENSVHNQTILSVFLYRSSVCAGYAKSMQYLLNKAGIPCTYLWGKTTYADEEHAWNMIKLNDHYYYLDATNGDISDEEIDQRWRYDFMTMNSEQMLQLYQPKEKYEETTAVEDSYFYQQNAYFTNYDESKIKALLEKEKKKEKPAIFFQCSTNDVCKDIDDKLKRDNKIFNLADENGIHIDQYHNYQSEETQSRLYELY